MKTQAEKIQELLKLIAENPDLPIVPTVDSDIVADDGHSSWIGGWGTAEIDRYIIRDERCYFERYDRDELVDKEWDRIMSEDLSVPETQQGKAEVELRVEQTVDAFEWIKCISVRITTP